jgi:hypothetical protein
MLDLLRHQVPDPLGGVNVMNFHASVTHYRRNGSTGR